MKDSQPGKENQADSMKQVSLQWLTNTQANVGKGFRFLGDFATEFSRPFTERMSSSEQAAALAFGVPAGLIISAGIVMAFIAAPLPTTVVVTALVGTKAVSALHHADKHFEARERTRSNKMEFAAKHPEYGRYRWSHRYSKDKQ